MTNNAPSTARESVAVRDAILRQDLSSFIAKSFDTVAPGHDFAPNWHIDLLADYLQACQQGEIKRLVVNIPPRSLKSISVSVAWPAWLLGHRPEGRILTASYSQHLAVKHSLDCRLLLQSGWYQRLFPRTRIARDQNEKHRFTTTRRGFRLATSVGGTLTGEGGNLIIVDDPLNPKQAMSASARRQVNDWYRQTLMSRLDDPIQGAVVIVMQRLHPDDLTGFVLEQGGWEQLCLPVQAPRSQRFSITENNYHWPAEDYLHPARHDKQTLARLQKELGSHAFASQYLQAPVPAEGMMIQPGWLQYYTEPPHGRCVHSWDTAIKTGQANDYSVCTVWLVTEDGYYLHDLWRARADYPSLKHQVMQMAERYPPEAILIEDKASGQSLLQELRRHTRLPVIGCMPKADKVTRLAQVSALMESGRVFLPKSASWLAGLEAELFAFPASTHDDQVDSLTQCLLWDQAQQQRLQAWSMRWL